MSQGGRERHVRQRERAGKGARRQEQGTAVVNVGKAGMVVKVTNPREEGNCRQQEEPCVKSRQEGKGKGDRCRWV